jgi:hypothetical protein
LLSQTAILKQGMEIVFNTDTDEWTFNAETFVFVPGLDDVFGTLYPNAFAQFGGNWKEHPVMVSRMT